MTYGSSSSNLDDLEQQLKEAKGESNRVSIATVRGKVNRIKEQLDLCLNDPDPGKRARAQKLYNEADQLLK